MVLSRSIKQFDRLGSTIKEAQASTRNITAFQKLKQDLSAAETAFQQARDRLATLRREMQSTARPTRQMRANLALAHKEVHRLGQRLDQQRQALMQQRRAMQAAGQSTEGLTAQKKRLAHTVGQLRRQYDRLGEALKRRDAVLQKRAALRSQLVDTVALGAAIAAPVRAAMQFESVMADVRKVVSFDSPEQFRQMQKDLLKLSTVIPMSAAGLGEVMAAAGQAGISRDELRQFTTDAAKMGVAFDMTGADAGSAMTGLRSIFKLNQPEVIALGDAYNHLSNNMDATARDMLKIANRTGSTAELFGLTGQQVGALGATFLALKTPPEVAATGINALLLKLQTADKQGGRFQDALSSKAIIGLTTGLIAMKVAAVGLAYAGTFVIGGFFSAVTVLRTLGAGVMLARAQLTAFNAVALVTATRARTLAIGSAIKGFGAALAVFAGRAVPVAIGALRALTVAFMSNPVGLIAPAWRGVTGFFGGLWDGIIARARDALDWVLDKFQAVTGIIRDILNTRRNGLTRIARLSGYVSSTRIEKCQCPCCKRGFLKGAMALPRPLSIHAPQSGFL